MTGPSLPTIKQLFALSGNRCAFPRCALPIVEIASGKPVGRICHIRATSPNGPRHDQSQTSEKRHAFANLILLCPIHHDVIDADTQSYTVERLEQMKADHETANAGGQEAPDEVIQALVRVSELNVNEGSILLSFQQSGGQVAHAITNLYGASSTAAQKLHEEHVEILSTVWQKLTETYRYAEQIGNGLSRAPNLNGMTDRQLAEFLEHQVDMRGWEKEELLARSDKTDYYRDWEWWWLANQAREKWRDLYRYVQATRIFMDESLKASLAEVTDLLSQVFVRAEVAKGYHQQDFDKSYAALEQLQPKFAELESMITSRLRRGA